MHIRRGAFPLTKGKQPPKEGGRAMKRSLCYALMAAFLLLPWGAWAGEAAPGAAQEAAQPGYEGDWYWFADFQFGLLLPAAWQPVAVEEEVFFMASDAQGRYAMWLELYGNPGRSMDTVLAELQALPQFTQVEGVYHGGVPFVRYWAEEGNLLGYATLTGDEQILLFFKFTPAGEPALAALAEQIMTTVSAVNRAQEANPHP